MNYKRLNVTESTVYDRLGRPHYYIKHEYIKECLICNKEFPVTKSDINLHKACSKPCADKLISITLKGRPHSKEHNKNVSLSKFTGKWINCANCEKAIYRMACELRDHDRFFCSNKCLNIFKKTSLWGKELAQISNITKIKNGTLPKGDKHYKWKGNRTALNLAVYQSDAMVNWRNFIFNRDNFTCQVCKVRGGKLHAHHIKYLVVLLSGLLLQYSQDYIHKNCNDIKELWDTNNGATLCSSCHRKVHINPSLLPVSSLIG